MIGYRFIKRAFDIVVSSLVLAVGAPVIAFVAFVVRAKLGSPILFKQQRPGLHETVFEIVKFRTMTDARDKHGDLLSDDIRLTSFGRFLRSTSLDELPELLNVVRGDMSLVGPRPLKVEYLGRYSPAQRRRHNVRPGITGLAQVSGRNSLPWEERFELDVYYVDNLSLKLDLQVLAKTISSVLKRDGISEAGEATMTEFRG